MSCRGNSVPYRVLLYLVLSCLSQCVLSCDITYLTCHVVPCLVLSCLVSCLLFERPGASLKRGRRRRERRREFHQRRRKPSGEGSFSWPRPGSVREPLRVPRGFPGEVDGLVCACGVTCTVSRHRWSLTTRYGSCLFFCGIAVVFVRFSGCRSFFCTGLGKSER